MPDGLIYFSQEFLFPNYKKSTKDEFDDARIETGSHLSKNSALCSLFTQSSVRIFSMYPNISAYGKLKYLNPLAPSVNQCPILVQFQRKEYTWRQ